MRLISALAVCAILFLGTASEALSKTWTGITQTQPSVFRSQLLQQNGSTVDIRFQLPGFFQSEVNTPQGSAIVLSADKAARLLEAGSPDLLKLTSSIIVPDQENMQVTVVSSHFTEINNIIIAPSKGNLKRDQDPASIPYSYNSTYSTNAFYPGQLAELGRPYILRDFRGQAVIVYPFQYNAITKVLRVYDEITVRVESNGTSAGANSLQRSSAPAPNATFNSIYSSRFINYNQTNYSPTPETGNMLVISDPAFMLAMQPFVDWKNRIGQFTELVSTGVVGSDPNSIQSYIQNKYSTDGLTFVLFVGDGTQIPPYPSGYGPSDVYYGCTLGADAYPEVIIGRFSANDLTELQTQIDRTIYYEKYPDVSGAWYSKAVCIGSDQGPGDDNEYDYEHERNIRSKYLAYTYTDADELYDGSQGVVDAVGNPGPTDLVNSLNEGRGVITYTGHGSSYSFGTTDFSSSDVANLTNINQLPFIWSVACVNGDFEFGDCLAEALMRSTNNGEATGAIATLMSTINQSWDPPMDGQDEMVDLLVETYPGNVKHSFGGISVNGCMHMNDQYGTAGDEMTYTWTCFGDPSLTVRTATPLPITAVHDPVIDETSIVFPLNCNTNDAIACLSHHNQIMATATVTGGTATLTGLIGLTVGDTLDLAITAYNHIPYFGTVIVNASGSTGVNSLSQNSLSLAVNSLMNDDKANVVFTTTEEANLSADILTIEGQLVKSIFSNEKIVTGNHSVQFSLSGMSSGVYLMRLSGNRTNAVCRFVVANR